ncbi:sensor histidine kinase [Halorarius litoreus]|uniref:sensor histidine kinase n=1 Tax=Halorarius litoreus TaxID=2962676 RepID=UPI0020CBA2B5|nr:HAMP domain-containing sensor histidine kinase [Halorarius litoreus]
MYSPGETDVASGGRVADELAQWVIPATGLVLVVLGVGYWAATDTATFDMAIASLPAALTAVVWFGARRVDREAAFGRRLLGWTLVGAGALGGLVLFAFIVQGADPVDSFPLLQFMMGVGSLSGLLIGTNEIRSVSAAQEAERARLEAELSKRELDRLEFLNHLLRHHVLNKMNVVHGYAELVREQMDDGFEKELTTIEEETEEVTELIENVRVLVNSMTLNIELEPIELSPVLEREVASLRETNEATVETDIPDGVTVEADGLLRYVFENLLRNAVEHNDAAAPRVEVTVTVTDHTVSVRIADNGPGVPDDRKDSIFHPEENGTQGLGLYLADTLVTEYGGNVSVEDSALGGAAFVVDLRRV